MSPTRSHAMEPPSPGEIERYRQDGSLSKRLAFGKKLANWRTSPALVARKAAQLKALDSSDPVKAATTLPYPAGLPASGSPKVFALLIDFPDYPHHNDQSVFTSKLFGAGDEDEQPYESLTAYYNRSSYGQLSIQGTVLPWYRAQNNRATYTSSATLIKEALNYYKNSYDFTQFDSNSDGKIDYFMVFWTGPDTGWNTFWWAWCDMDGSTFTGDSFTVDGKRLGVYCWQWEGKPVGTEFQPRVVIHETGHGLGLPDLYDYDASKGVDGGVGGLDMMDANMGDHNAFSKWLLGWMNPTVLGASGSGGIYYLRPSSLYANCVAVMPGLSASNPFSEFYMIQNRSRRERDVSNDFNLPTDGLVVWHIDARLNTTGDGFAWDNSYTSHKLVRLMEADGLEEIEKGYAVDEGDFYGLNNYFSPLSSPDSASYADTRTGVTVLNISRLNTLLYPSSSFSANISITTTNKLGLAEALDNDMMTWTTYGSSSSQWYGQVYTSANDGDAARSPALANGESASLTTSFTGPGPVEFQWLVSSQSGSDVLEFYIDSVLQNSISGLMLGWQTKSYDLAAGKHILRWTYTKDASGSFGSDCGYVDFVKCANVPLDEALDCPLLTWTTPSSTGWAGQSVDYFYGGSAGRSLPIGDNAQSEMSTTALGPGQIWFYWKASCEPSRDQLEFLVDSTVIDSISGTDGDWALYTATVGRGTHTFKWRYSKDSRGSDGEDCGWVDRVVYSQISLGKALDNEQVTWLSETNPRWVSTTSPTHDGVDAAWCNVDTDNEQGLLHTAVLGPGTVKFYWMESTTQFNGDIMFYLDGSFKTWCDTQSWEQKTYTVDAGWHTLDWEYNSYSDTADYGALDQFEFIPDAPSLGEAIDNLDLSLLVNGPYGWVGEVNNGAFGLDCAHSGPVADNQQSYMETYMTGPGTLVFDWKVSSEANKDWLEITVDGYNKARISGTVDWEHQQIILPKGPHTITWYYYKNSSVSAGEDCGWVDRVYLKPAPSLGEALDCSSVSWQTGGSLDWQGQDLTWKTGGSAVRSGAITHKQDTTLWGTVKGPCTFAFEWRTSSGSGDVLSFSIDDAKQTQTSGLMSDWETKTYSIPNGQHVVLWRFAKDFAFSDYEDCAWVDHVVVTPIYNAADKAWEKVQ